MSMSYSQQLQLLKTSWWLAVRRILRTATLSKNLKRLLSRTAPLTHLYCSTTTNSAFSKRNLPSKFHWRRANKSWSTKPCSPAASANASSTAQPLKSTKKCARSFSERSVQSLTARTSDLEARNQFHFFHLQQEGEEDVDQQ